MHSWDVVRWFVLHHVLRWRACVEETDTAVRIMTCPQTTIHIMFDKLGWNDSSHCLLYVETFQEEQVFVSGQLVSTFRMHLCVRLFLSLLICVCHDLSCGNSCSGVELITGWVFWGEPPPRRNPTPLPPRTPSRSLLYYRALSKWQSAFVQPFEILVTFLSDAQPNNKGAFMLWSRLGKDIDKTLVGKDLGLCQVVHAV